MQKTRLTESQLKVKKIITPIIESILLENNNANHIPTLLKKLNLDITKEYGSSDNRKHINFNPADCGIFQLLFRTINVEIKGGLSPNDGGYIIFSFKFKCIYNFDDFNSAYQKTIDIFSHDGGKTWKTGNPN